MRFLFIVMCLGGCSGLSRDCEPGYVMARDIYTDAGFYLETIPVDGGGYCVAEKRKD